MASDVGVTITCKLTKADDSLQTVFGFASIAVLADGAPVTDAHGDQIALADLEVAAYEFIGNGGVSGEDHAGDTDGVIVESMVFTPDKLEALGLAKDALPGAWWVGVYLEDRAAYERAKTSKTAFSIEGKAEREAL